MYIGTKVVIGTIVLTIALIAILTIYAARDVHDRRRQIVFLSSASVVLGAIITGVVASWLWKRRKVILTDDTSVGDATINAARGKLARLRNREKRHWGENKPEEHITNNQMYTNNTYNRLLIEGIAQNLDNMYKQDQMKAFNDLIMYATSAYDNSRNLTLQSRLKDAQTFLKHVFEHYQMELPEPVHHFLPIVPPNHDTPPVVLYTSIAS